MSGFTPAALSLRLRRLEAESIDIITAVVAEFRNPVMLYSIGKDSGVMLHLARKAFYPSSLPFPLLHVDTGWKFRDMLRHRDQIATTYGLKLLVHTNMEGVALGINPIASGPQLHTHVMKAAALKQALNKWGFDAAFGGARRDEQKLRAKERASTLGTVRHIWDSHNERLDLWSLYNSNRNCDGTIRVFPLSKWTELDIWQYTYAEGIPLVPLYLAAPRPIVRRNGVLIMRDDDRMPLQPREQEQVRTVRFRSLGCYPMTAAIESRATTVKAIIDELIASRTSERSRPDRHDQRGFDGE